MGLVPSQRCTETAAASGAPGLLPRIGLAGLGLLFGLGLVVASASVASATPGETLYVDNVNGMATTGCTDPGAAACQTIQEGVTAAEALTGTAVTLDVAGSSTAYDEEVTINIPSSSTDTLSLAGGEGTPSTINDAGSGTDITIASTSTAAVNISGFTITGGDALNGGGLDNEGSGTVTLDNDTLSGNESDDGGAIDSADGVAGSLIVSNSTFFGNQAADGGAIDSGDSGTPTNSVVVTNSTFTGNAGDDGGAIAVWGGSTATLNDDTLSNNTAIDSGGGISDHGSLTISNSLLAANTVGSPDPTTPSNCAHVPTDGGYNVSSDDTCQFGSTSINSSTDIGTLTLEANGSTGPETEAITTSSSAYQEVPLGSCSGVTTDERGLQRPGTGESACDAGAYEVQNPVQATSCSDPSGNTAFVCALYQDLLDRTADSGGLAAFDAQLSSGTSRSAVATEILNSAEYRTDLISSYYEDYLGRAVDPSGKATFLSVFGHGGSNETVQSDILGSGEFYNDHGDTAHGFLTALYGVIFDRALDASGMATFTAQLSSGTSRSVVAFEVLDSTEYHNDLISSYYQDYLDRQADPSGRATFLNVFNHGGSNETVQADILSSAEYPPPAA